MQKISRFGLTALVVFCLNCAALAQEVRLPPAPEQLSAAMAIEQFGSANPGCGEWSDSCQICKQGTDGKARCSTPAIACQKTGIVCRLQPVPPASAKAKDSVQKSPVQPPVDTILPQNPALARDAPEAPKPQ
jgi:hypothetical protein